MRYVRRKPVIFWTVVMVAVIAVFAFNMPVFLAAYANNVFDVGAQGYGLFNALVAAGALAGALASTRRTSVRLSMVVGTAAALGIVQAVAGLRPERDRVRRCCSSASASATCSSSRRANSLVQMSSNVQIRGRVISLYILVLLGGQALGGPLMGWIVEQVGPHIAMAISGVVPAAAAAVDRRADRAPARASGCVSACAAGGPVIAIVNRAGKAGATL